jgi:leucyl aminopeptidase
VARDLSNEPGGACTPEHLAAEARKLARSHGLKITVFTEKELAREKMGGILAVGRGSANPPRLIALEYGAAARKAAKGARRRPTLVFVGKGITFDSGGISIKPAANMDEMKHDMSGAAAVIGALRAISDLKLPVHAVGLVAAAQNMPDGNAYVPGDVITSARGKTIEVLNTDAEGRIVLSDALHYATSFEPDAIIDLATLTGACVVALGDACCAVLGNDEKLAQKVRDAGDATHERAWPLPLWDEHKNAIKGTFGDIVNTGGRNAGVSTAAAFLSHFVGETPWAHLDIAGTAWTTKETPYYAKGATGFGVRLLVDLARNWK